MPILISYMNKALPLANTTVLCKNRFISRLASLKNVRRECLVTEHPRLPPSCFWLLTLCKDRGWRPGWFYHDVILYPTMGGVLNQKNELETLACIVASAWVLEFWIFVKRQTCCAGWKLCAWNTFFRPGTSSPPVYLVDINSREVATHLLHASLSFHPLQLQPIWRNHFQLWTLEGSSKSCVWM